MPGRVTTVRGDIDAEQLGFTLMHEHLFSRFWEATYRFDLAGMPEDPRYVLEELEALREHGGQALVDMTPIGINRLPEELLAASESVDMHVVMATGWYRDHYFPASAELERRSVDNLAEELIGEIEHGVGGSRIRPGIIGEIGTEKSWVSPTEERVHRAAARAAIATGLPLMTHSFASDVGRAQLRIFEEEGLDLRRVIVGHADTYRVEQYHRELLATGATIEFDTLCWYRPTLFDDALDMIEKYLSDGFGDQIMISMDNCKSEHLRAFGGAGFLAVHEQVLPGLAKRGVDADALDGIFRRNPARMLAH